MLKNYFKIAWRNIWKNRTTSFINITGLSIGMTAAVLIMLWVQNERNFDTYHKDGNSIYRLTTRIPSSGWVWETTPLLLADAIKSEIPEIEKVARLYTNNLPIFNVNGSLFYARNCAYVDKDWFNIFQYDFKEGDAAPFYKNPFSIILTSSEAKKYFGDIKAVGQTIHIDSIDYQVTGVVADAPLNSSFQYKAFIPVSALLTNSQIRENDANWNNFNYATFVKIIPGSVPENVSRKITSLLAKKNPQSDPTSVSMISLSDMHFETEIENSSFAHGNRNAVIIFSFLGFLLLLIACINYVNLTTARATLRAKEVSIRKISGANRLQLFMQFIVDSVIVSLISLAVTLVLIQFCLPIFNQLTGRDFMLPLISANLWKIIVITLLSTIVLNSIYPALLLSSFKPLNVFRGNSVLKVKDSTFRKGLVVLQFTVSVLLITGTIIIYSQMQFIQNRQLGYNRSQVISFALPPGIEGTSRESLTRSIKQELLSQSGIQSVSTSNQPVIRLGSMCTECADWAGRDKAYNPRIMQLSADAGFKNTMQLQMKEGDWFNEGDAAEKHNFILNETAVKDFKLPVPAIGQRFVFKGDTGQVIGVVKDFAYSSMHQKTGPVVVFNDPTLRHYFAVRLAAGNTIRSLSNIEKTWKKFIPKSPFEYTFMDETFNNFYKEDRQTSLLIFVFAVIAIILSAMGLFSLAAFEAQKRIKEIGVRKVLGATVMQITNMLSATFLKLVFIACLLAFPLAWWVMNKWLQDFAYRINISWYVFAIAGFVALIIALVTVSFQSIKAALANPVKSLRSE